MAASLSGRINKDMKRHLCIIIMLMISFQIAKAQSSNGFVYKEYDSSWIVFEVD